MIFFPPTFLKSACSTAGFVPALSLAEGQWRHINPAEPYCRQLYFRLTFFLFTKVNLP